jgi:cytidylate kinase
MIIAIDGPAGSGKSTTAKAVAKRLGFVHLDTGAMYRAITLKALTEKVDYKDIPNLKKCVDSAKIEFIGTVPDVKVFLNGKDVSDEIRSSEVTENVSDYCAPTVVREALVAQQREIGKDCDMVCEGRDMSTVVFPNAEIQIYMVASVDARAKRRVINYSKMGVTKTKDELIVELEERDHKDSSRENSPLKKADKAILLDTTNITFSEQVDQIVEMVEKIK